MNSTRSGGKSQISEVRRVMPRSARVIGRLWPLGSISVPGTVPRNCRLSIKVASGAWMLMWILSEEANSGFAAARRRRSRRGGQENRQCRRQPDLHLSRPRDNVRSDGSPTISSQVSGAAVMARDAGIDADQAALMRNLDARRVRRVSHDHALRPISSEHGCQFLVSSRSRAGRPRA